VHCAAFEGDFEAQLVRRLRAADSFDPSLSSVAAVENDVIGHILFSSVQIINPRAMTPALALAPMAVRPEFQRRGVGTRLVEDGLRACLGKDHKIIVVLGHASYYPRFGFERASQFGIHPPFVVPDEAFMVLALAPGAMNGVQGVVRFPPAFEIDQHA
jgi:putative acetyltransferase